MPNKNTTFAGGILLFLGSLDYVVSAVGAIDDVAEVVIMVAVALYEGFLEHDGVGNAIDALEV